MKGLGEGGVDGLGGSSSLGMTKSIRGRAKGQGGAVHAGCFLDAGSSKFHATEAGPVTSLSNRRYRHDLW